MSSDHLVRPTNADPRLIDLPLFGASAPVVKGSAVEDALKAVEPDALSPKEALEVLYELKKKLNN